MAQDAEAISLLELLHRASQRADNSFARNVSLPANLPFCMQFPKQTG